MSLRVWLPLNGDLHNQGLSTAFLSGSPTWGTGKIGSKSFCCSTGIAGITINDLVDVTTFSIAYWLYIDSSITDFTNYTDFWELQAVSGDTTTVIRDELRTNTANLGRHALHMIKDASVGSNTNTYYGLGERDDAKDKWCHVVITKDANYCDAYANGVRYAHASCSNFETSPAKLNGKFWLGMSGCKSTYLNDFRIYDHCLSEQEIKKLAQGLVVHYPLNRQGWGQENLVINSINLNNFINESATYVSLTRTSSDLTAKIITTPPSGSRYGFYQDIDCTVSTQYTVSFEVVSMSGDFACAVGSRTGNSVGWSNLSGYTTCTIGKNIKTFTTISDCTKLRIYMGALSNNSILVVKNVKLEKGSIATPWSPNSSDELATTLGLNNGVEYDISGFGNNGTRVGSFTWSSDTPKYEVSTEFNSSHPDYIQVPNSSYALQGAEAMTVSVWAYKDDWTSYAERIYSSTEGGGYNIEYNSTNMQWPVNVYTNADKTSYAYANSDPNLYLAVAKSSLSSGWHMFTWVYNTAGTYLYIDGILKNSKAATSYGLHFNTTAPLIIGGEATGTGATTPYFTGKQSDFRIYATAFSADDVKSLYQNCATIAADGTIYGQIRN